MQTTNFKLKVKKTSASNKTIDYSTQPSSHGLPTIHNL